MFNNRVSIHPPRRYRPMIPCRWRKNTEDHEYSRDSEWLPIVCGARRRRCFFSNFNQKSDRNLKSHFFFLLLLFSFSSLTSIYFALEYQVPRTGMVRTIQYSIQHEIPQLLLKAFEFTPFLYRSHELQILQWQSFAVIKKQEQESSLDNTRNT